MTRYRECSYVRPVLGIICCYLHFIKQTSTNHQEEYHIEDQLWANPADDETWSEGLS